MNPALKTKPRFLRANPAKGTDARYGIDPTGGDYGAGLIPGVSIITEGEASGHDLWIDSAFTQDVADAINTTTDGVKARFTHPGLSGDGMGKFLGRVKNARSLGKRAVADLHLSESAHQTPDGDLAGYVMKLAEDDPAAFGMSVVFESDTEAEAGFVDEHMSKDGEFVSPDALNVNNYPHARLFDLRAADVVDDPAANPSGLFHRGQEIAQEAEAVLCYSFGLSDTPPKTREFDIDPDRVSGFVKRFLDSHGLEVVPKHKESSMPEPTTTQNDAVSVTVDADAVRAEGAKSERERFAALSSKYSDPQFVAEQFAAGVSVEAADAAWQAREIARLKTELEQANEKLAKQAPLAASGAEPVGFKADDGGEDFMALARRKSEAEKIPLHKAMSAIAKAHPEVYAKSRA